MGLDIWLVEVCWLGNLASVFWGWSWISQFGEGCQSLGPRLQHLLAFWLWLLHACLSASGGGEGQVCSQLGLLWYSLSPLFCEETRLRVNICHGKALFFPLWQSHSLGCYLTLAPSDCPSGNSGLVLILSTDYAARASLSRPCLLVVDLSV